MADKPTTSEVATEPERHYPPRLLLWDIDGTLLTSTSVGKVAANEAIAEVLGRECEPLCESPTGRTDRYLATAQLAANGVGDEEMASKVRRMLRAFGTRYAALRDVYQSEATLCAGVRELLVALSATNALNTLLTGNIASNAVMKLHAMNLQEFFDFEIGAYGGESVDRTELFLTVEQNIGKFRNDAFDDHEIWVIGDTVHDFEVAQAHNLRCLLVATGSTSFEDLNKLGATKTLHDLSNTNEVIDLLFS